jgi:rhodanese-related sulfurtransferase
MPTIASPLWLVALIACSAPPTPEPAEGAAARALPSCSPGEVTFSRAPSGAHEVDAQWLAQNRCAVRIVDLRQREELEGELGRIDGAEWVPLERLEEVASTWSAEGPVVLVDRSGRRAARAQSALEAAGLRRVASLTGGMLAWRDEGWPVVSGALPAPTSDPTPSTGVIARDPVATRLADPRRIQWVPISAILGGGSEQCIDGRAEGPVVGTPGGDAGELVLALSAFEHTARRSVPDAAVAPMLAAYAQGFGRFYVHTDTHALARLGEALAVDARFAPLTAEGPPDPARVEALVRRPPPELEEALLAQLVQSDHVGCGHLRLMLEHPSEYGVRRELVEAVLRESFRLGWSHPELLSFAVLEGEHEESAVARVWLDRPVHTYTRVPTFPSTGPGEASVFVAHPEVSAFLRAELGSFLLENASTLGVRAPELEPFHHELDALAARQIAATLRHLARELPVYDVHVRDGAPTVSGPNGSAGCRDY